MSLQGHEDIEQNGLIEKRLQGRALLAINVILTRLVICFDATSEKNNGLHLFVLR